MEPAAAIIEMEAVEKVYGGASVLDRVDLAVRRGEIFALLGPNGAGKTTTINILATLVKPDRGRATVAGFDVVDQPSAVRSAISLTGQHVAVDGFLTGEENLRMMARLAHLGRAEAQQRVGELISQFDLESAATRRVDSYSGGMRRRLDLAISLIAKPPVIFLDEPTAGLDPRSRQALWSAVEALAADGVTIFLTTQYLDEADRLADRVAVIDAGRIVASGTPEELKQRISGETVELGFADIDTFLAAVAVLADARPILDHDRLTISIGSGSIGSGSIGSGSIGIGAAHTVGTVKRVIDLLDRDGLEIASIMINRPSLDDVFMSLTARVGSEVAA